MRAYRPRESPGVVGWIFILPKSLDSLPIFANRSIRVSIAESLVHIGTWTATADPSCEPTLYGGMERSGRVRNMPPPIKTKEATKTKSPSLTTVSSCRLGSGIGKFGREKIYRRSVSKLNIDLMVVICPLPGFIGFRPITGDPFVLLTGLDQSSHAYDPVVGTIELNDADALRIAADLTHVIHLAPKDLSLGRHDNDLIVIPHLQETHRHPVPLGGLDADDAFAGS